MTATATAFTPRRTERHIAERIVGFRLFFDVDLFIGSSGELEYAGLPLQLEPSEVDGISIRATTVATHRDGRTMSASMENVPHPQ